MTRNGYFLGILSIDLCHWPIWHANFRLLSSFAGMWGSGRNGWGSAQVDVTWTKEIQIGGWVMAVLPLATNGCHALIQLCLLVGLLLFECVLKVLPWTATVWKGRHATFFASFHWWNIALPSPSTLVWGCQTHAHSRWVRWVEDVEVSEPLGTAWSAAWASHHGNDIYGELFYYDNERPSTTTNRQSR